jgi:hypothetical protein
MLLIGSLCATVRRPFLYRQTIDLEGSEGSPTIVKNMVDVGLIVMRDWQAAMARVIFAKTTAKQIFAEDPLSEADAIDKALPSVRTPAPSTIQ